MKKEKTILNSIGNTPLLEIEGIYVKAEHLNPTGSMKDRIALFMIEEAEKSGKLKKGDTIVESTSGNTGTALAFVGAMKGYKVIIFIPKGLTRERYQMMVAFGAELRIVPEQRFDIAMEKASELGNKKGFYWTRQFENPKNPEEHEKHMSKEILKQMKNKKIDAIINGIGTGGTIIGLGKAFKKLNNNCKVFGVEPMVCSLTYDTIHNLPVKECKPHRIEGIGDTMVPKIVGNNIKIIDDIIKIKSSDAIVESKRIARKHGCFVGICSGANLLAAKKVQKKYTNLKNIVTLFTDEGEKYLSEEWFSVKY